MGSHHGGSADDEAHLHHAEEAAGESIEKMREAAAECYAAGQAEVQQATQMLEEYVQKHPLKSLAFAAGAGFLVALFVMRRR